MSNISKRVWVEKMGTKLECRFGVDKFNKPVWKCGNCLRGIVEPVKGSKCKCCIAIVCEVQE